MTESMMHMAETFLVKCLKTTTDLETFDLLSLMALPSKWTRENPHHLSQRKKTYLSILLIRCSLDMIQQVWVQAPDATGVDTSSI